MVQNRKVDGHRRTEYQPLYLGDPSNLCSSHEVPASILASPVRAVNAVVVNRYEGSKYVRTTNSSLLYRLLRGKRSIDATSFKGGAI